MENGQTETANDRQMKIGIEVQRLFRKKKFGIETSALEMIKTMLELEPRHEYVVFAKDDVDRNCLPHSDRLKVKLVPGQLFFDFEQILLPMAARHERVDLLHCTGNTTPFFASVPIVQTLHDVIFMDKISSTDTPYQRFGNRYRRGIVPLVTRRSNAVITVSRYEKERITRVIPVNPDRIHVVYNGINEKRFNNQLPLAKLKAIAQKYGLPERYILFLGNEATRKNPVRTIDAYVRYASQCEQAMPLVAPGLSQKFVDGTLHTLNASVKQGQIITTGYIDEEDLPGVYALSRAFVFPSLSEGFGLPMIEAMACGVPVVASSASCLPEIAGNAAVLADPLNADEIASGIMALATNDSLRARKISEGLENARRFTARRAAEATISIYEMVYAEAIARGKKTGLVHATKQ